VRHSVWHLLLSVSRRARWAAAPLVIATARDF
jgi:hypothetical protein